ncbi:LIM zinc-binding domain-containing Nebulette [Varanus komodoensis]|nr:LIM zinc-binding domain-containing Nebulette [Varanus komodoensis]
MPYSLEEVMPVHFSVMQLLCFLGHINKVSPKDMATCTRLGWLSEKELRVQRTYRAMYDYSAQDEDEVSFRDGDYIINVQPIDDGWMYGTVQRTGKTGMLPANYIEFVN